MTRQQIKKNPATIIETEQLQSKTEKFLQKQRKEQRMMQKDR